MVMWDGLSGMQRKKDIVLKSYLLAEYIRKIPGERIGIMLPAVSSVSFILLGCYLAQKTPVMFNWTLSEEGFDHCVEFSGVENILCSRSFFEKVRTDFLSGYEEKEVFVFVEDLLKNISFSKKLCAWGKHMMFSLPSL